MATDGKALRPRRARPMDRLRDVWHEAEQWPLAGHALKRVHGIENRALQELKHRLDALERSQETWPGTQPVPDEPADPVEMLTDLLARGHSVDPDRARRDLYRRVLSALVPDEVAVLRLLHDRGTAPLCDIGGSWLPAGSISVMWVRNASSLGQEAGVLLREFVPQYMSHLRHLGLVQPGPADAAPEADFELLLADAGFRQAMDEVRERLRLYPRVIRRTVHLSPLGAALWRDCFPAAQAINARRPGN